MKKQQLRLAVLCLLLVACSQFSAQAGTIEAINHTKWAINRFSVDGNPGIDSIGPYQGGGGGLLPGPGEVAAWYDGPGGLGNRSGNYGRVSWFRQME